MASITYQVVGAVAVVKTTGGDRYLYRGAVLPANADRDHINHLVAVGLVEKAVKPKPDPDTGTE